MDGLLGVRGVIEVEDEAADTDTLARDLAAGVVQLVADLVEARRAEGRQLEQVVTGQVERIAALTQAAEENPARQPEAVRA
ncbi:YicC family protein, partial [Mameliella sp. CS4]|nr:YicC family protein [Mameliella sp. CS4]